jgi:hypothetical protein
MKNLYWIDNKFLWARWLVTTNVFGCSTFERHSKRNSVKGVRGDSMTKKWQIYEYLPEQNTEIKINKELPHTILGVYLRELL